MYAVVEIQGSQFKVEKNQKLFVNRIDAKEGSKISFDNVLLLDDGKKVQVGKPNLSGTSVEAKVVAHIKDDKVIVFKKKRRKGYKVKNGHRQPITEIIIQGIGEKKTATKKEAASEKSPAAKKAPAAKKSPAAKKALTAKKSPAAKKAPAAKKSPAAKK
jgi:large subunit ribosomal protein L21